MPRYKLQLVPVKRREPRYTVQDALLGWPSERAPPPRSPTSGNPGRAPPPRTPRACTPGRVDTPQGEGNTNTEDNETKRVIRGQGPWAPGTPGNTPHGNTHATFRDTTKKRVTEGPGIPDGDFSMEFPVIDRHAQVARTRTPSYHVIGPQTLDKHVTRPKTPGSHVTRPQTPGSHVIRPQTPGSHVSRSQPPRDHVTRQKTPENHVTIPETSDRVSHTTSPYDVSTARLHTPTHRMISAISSQSSNPHENKLNKPNSPTYHVNRPKTPARHVTRQQTPTSHVMAASDAPAPHRVTYDESLNYMPSYTWIHPELDKY
jgi:hypothetical protein